MDYIQIDKLITTSFYKQISHSIKDAILKYEIKDNDQLPTELEVSTFFDISTGIVKRAYDLLEQEGLIKRIKGKGSFVTYRQQIELDVSLIKTGHASFIHKNSYRNQLLLKDHVSNKNIAGFPYDELPAIMYKQITCLEYFKQEKVCINTVYFNDSLYPNVESIFPIYESYLDFSNHYFNVVIKKQSNRLLSIAASDELARMLSIEALAPINKIISIYYTSTQQIAMFQVRYFPSNLLTIKAGF